MRCRPEAGLFLWWPQRVNWKEQSCPGLLVLLLPDDLGLPDVASENTGFPIKAEFQINSSKNFFKCKYVPNNAWDILTLKKIFIF